MTSKIVSGKPALLKEINRNRIIQLLIRHKELGRAQLSKMTSLALPSVMRLVDGLIEEGLVIDIGKGVSSGGRKPNLVTLNKDALYIIGIEIAIETTVVISDIQGTIIDKWATMQMVDIVPEKLLEDVIKNINRMIATNAIETSKIAGIGIGTPGQNFKHLREIPKTILKGWESIDVKHVLEKQFKYPIFVDNVARTRTLAELWFGSGQFLKDFIYVFVDQGVGCGLVREGHIIKGHDNVTGEFGHTIVMVDGRPCYCGCEGCIEMYVSAGAILNEINKSEFRKIKTLSDIATYETESEIEAILKYAGKVLGIGISNLINIYNPEAIILGGKVPLISETFYDHVIEHIKPNVFSKNAEETQIILSQLSKEGLGGVALVYNELFKSIILS